MKDSEGMFAEIWCEGRSCSRDGDQLDAAGPTTGAASSGAPYEEGEYLPGHLPADATFVNFKFSAPSLEIHRDHVRIVRNSSAPESGPGLRCASSAKNVQRVLQPSESVHKF